MNVFITSKEDLKETVNDAVKQLIEKELPSIIRKAQRKEWMNTDDLMEFTGWSRRTIQYLRDNKRIPFSQEGRRILYSTEGIEDYLRSNQIDPYKE